MTATTNLQTTCLEQSAARAFAARRRLQLSAPDAREALSFSYRSMLDHFLKVPPERLFDTAELSAGAELLMLLKDAVNLEGGAPVVRHTDEGDRYTVGGTEPGRCIQAAADSLSELLTEAWKVSDHLAAAAALASKRDALSRESSSGARR